MSASLRLELRPSYVLASLIVLAHAAAAASLVFLMPDARGALLGAALLALGGASAWSRALLRGRAAVRVLELFAVDPASPARRRYVSRLLVTLPLGGRTLLVTADMLEPQQFRRLRIWALWGKLPAVAGEQPVG